MLVRVSRWILRDIVVLFEKNKKKNNLRKHLTIALNREQKAFFYKKKKKKRVRIARKGTNSKFEFEFYDKRI